VLVVSSTAVAMSSTVAMMSSTASPQDGLVSCWRHQWKLLQLVVFAESHWTTAITARCAPSELTHPHAPATVDDFHRVGVKVT
jgi:hypothetical protein